MIETPNNKDLLNFTSELLDTVTAQEVAKKFTTLGIKLFKADAGSIAILNDENTLNVIQTKGYKSSVVKKWSEIKLSENSPLASAVRLKKPQFIKNNLELEKNYKSFFKKITITKAKSWVALPIIYQKKVLGGIGLTYNTEQTFNQNDRTSFLSIAQQVSQALERATLYEAERKTRASLEYSQSKLRFLSEATKILGSSLEYKKTLANVARIVTPRLADWCGIDILTEKGTLQNLVVSHVDKTKVKLAKELQSKYPSDINDPASAVARAIKTGEKTFIPRVTPKMIKHTSRDAIHLRMINKLGLKSVMIIPLKGQNKILGAITFIQSNSKRQYTDEDMVFAEELAARAATAIDNAILYQKSIEGIKIRDEFLNIAAHELRTPLTSLQLQIQLLINHVRAPKEKINTTSLKNALLAGDQQTKRLGNLINNLMDISRMTSRKIELDIDKVNLNNLLLDVISRFETSLIHTGSVVVYKNDETLIGKWDKFRLDQVLTNLLSNAIKYGLGKPIKLTLKKNKNKAQIVIKDNGMGISREDIKRIFNRFVRTETAKKYGGLGLGLYISKQIVEAHKGTISVNSAPNQGTKFTIKLPLN